MSSLVRLSKPGKGELKDGVVPHPVYGDQLQGQSTSLAHQFRKVIKKGEVQHDVAPEAYVHINWVASTYTYTDGEQVTLRKPELMFKNLGYGELGDDTLTSLRVAPSIQGMGLLELISQQDINNLADENDQNGDGISGRINHVWDVEKQQTVPGRFGLKANKATLAMQVAGAFNGDVGITTSLFPNQPCSEQQVACKNMPTGNDQDGVELPDDLLNLVVNFNRNLAPVARRQAEDTKTLQGRTLFYQSGCAQCHNPSFVTAKSDQNPHLGEQTIWPYTDLLLHDMGPELADNRPDFEASGSEWRTAPLWGIGVAAQVNGSKALLHDGRAQTVEEAILWHGGEASGAKAAFTGLAKSERSALLQFVQSL